MSKYIDRIYKQRHKRYKFARPGFPDIDKDFLKYLNRSSAIVRTWPKWKQSILGGKI